MIHLDTDAPLDTDDGRLITDELWGIYYKRDRHGVQGGASPLTVDGDVELDPYPSTTNVDDEFPDMWCAALSHAMSRFEGCRPLYKQARSGGVGSFTADNFPVFDYLKPNVYGILDSNHGYKMIGVGREVARVLVRRLGAAADAVPLRALRDRRPPPGLELALPLELVRGGTHGSPTSPASNHRTRPVPSSLPGGQAALRRHLETTLPDTLGPVREQRSTPNTLWLRATRADQACARVVVEHPEDDRLAVAQVAPAADAAAVGDQRLSLAEHRPARREQHLHEPRRDVHDLDSLVREIGRRAAAGRQAHEIDAQTGAGSSSSGTGRSVSAWRGSSRRASR